MDRTSDTVDPILTVYSSPPGNQFKKNICFKIVKIASSLKVILGVLVYYLYPLGDSTALLPFVSLSIGVF